MLFICMCLLVRVSGADCVDLPRSEVQKASRCTFTAADPDVYAC